MQFSFVNRIRSVWLNALQPSLEQIAKAELKLLLVLVVSIAISVLLTVLSNLFAENSVANLFFGGMLAFYVAITATVLFRLRAKEEQLVRGATLGIGMRMLPFWPIPLAVITFLMAVAIGSIARYFDIDFLSVRDLSPLFTQLKQHQLLGLLFVVVLAPFCEELLFRRWLLQGFMDVQMPRLGAVVVSLNFAALHLTRYEISAASAVALVIFFTISLVWCWVYLRTRNVWASVATHAMHNAIAMSIAMLTGLGND